MAQIDFGLLDTSAPAKAAGSVMAGYRDMQDRQNALALREITLQDAQAKQKNALLQRDILSKTADPNQLVNQYRSAGLHDEAFDAEAKMLGNRTKELQNIKAQAEVAERGAALIMANPTLENAVRVLQKASSTIGVDVSDDIAQLQAIGDNPEAIYNWAVPHAVQAKDLMGKFGTLDLGDQKVVGRETWDGRFEPRQSFNVGVSPGTGRLTPIANTAGDVTFFDAQGNPVKRYAGAGKGSAEFEKTKLGQEKNAATVGTVINELTEITKPGGLIEKATGGGMQALGDKVAGFFGEGTPGSIAIARLAPISDMVLKLVPRFEGPQSDKDTASYKEAAGRLSDPTVPLSVKMAAAKEIRRLLVERRAQFANKDALPGMPPGLPSAGGMPPGLPPGLPPGVPPTGSAGQPVIPTAQAARTPITKEAVDALRRGEGTSAQFDAVFGEGAAARALGAPARSPTKGASGRF